MPRPRSIIIDDGNYHQPGICDSFTSQFSPRKIKKDDYEHAEKSFNLTHAIISDPSLSEDTRRSYLTDVYRFKNRNFTDPKSGRNAVDVYKTFCNHYFPSKNEDGTEKTQSTKKSVSGEEEECSVIPPIPESSSEDEHASRPENASLSTSGSIRSTASIPTGTRFRPSSLGSNVQRRVSLIEKNYASPTTASLARAKSPRPRTRTARQSSPTWLSDYASTPSTPGDERTG